MPEYKWHPIEDIPEELYNYADPDLLTLSEEWQEVRKETSDEILVKILNEIKREWAIETGKIEGLYTLSRGITKTLIQHGISAKLIPHNSTNLGPNELTQILEDQYEVIEGLMDYVGQRKALTLHYIRQIHEVFTRHQDTTEGVREDGTYVQVPLLKGQWKKWPNNPEQKDETIHEYCPPEQVQIEMEHLLELHEKHEKQNVRPEVEAAFLHHRFTQIHPFQDGNGRIARALASLVFLRANVFPFVVGPDERFEYIESLENADNRNLLPLIRFIAEKQKDVLYTAIRKSSDREFEKGLSTVEGKLENYIDAFEMKKSLVNKANFILNTWDSISKEIIKKYGDVLRASGLTSDSLIAKTSKGSKQISTNKISPGKTDLVIGKIFVYTHIIKFPNQSVRYFLKLFPKDVTTDEINLIAELSDSNGKTKKTHQCAANRDLRLADLEFREWFQVVFDEIVKNYMSF
jgi:Fic family protein